MMKRIAILGSTGSIGVNTLDVLSKIEDKFKVVALSANKNVTLLARQAARFKPKILCVGADSLSGDLKRLNRSKAIVVSGADGLKEIVARRDVDLVVFAIGGLACLVPLIEAIKNKKQIALANKESLVSAGPVISKLARQYGVNIIPIDSEHSAIFQCLDGRNDKPSKIYLTSSGGPLLNVKKVRFDKLSRGFILNHPKWRMGKKISVDSATMMNKGIEIIEAQMLFGIPEASIEVLVHPEAVIHSMVEFRDGAILAQLGIPDMRVPIQYALTYPCRQDNALARVDFSGLGALSFKPPDCNKFPSLNLARKAARSGGTAPAVLCAADEEAVTYFLNGRIKFTDIPKVIEKVLSRHVNMEDKLLSLDSVLAAQLWAREEARSICCH